MRAITSRSSRRVVRGGTAASDLGVLAVQPGERSTSISLSALQLVQGGRLRSRAVDAFALGGSERPPYALIERELASQALDSDEIRRLMTVPGVSLVSAATFVAIVGDAHRFGSPKKLVSYLGLDPRVRQSGEAPARHGRISKQGSPEAPHAL